MQSKDTTINTKLAFQMTAYVWVNSNIYLENIKIYY